MASRILIVYLTIRRPRNFLILLCCYIVASLTAHFGFEYDGDLGLTNLVLSIEASTAGAVLMMVAEESAEASARMLKAILQLVEEIRCNTAATLAIAEAQRDMQKEHAALMRALVAHDPRILEILAQGETKNEQL
jgi:hypothetical protein